MSEWDDELIEPTDGRDVGEALRIHNRDRMKEWRTAQIAAGRVQIRTWVPASKADQLLEFAARLRDEGAERGVVPSTPQQRYEARRAAKSWDMPLPADTIWHDRMALAVWLTIFDPQLIEDNEVTPPHPTRLEEAQELAAQANLEMPLAVRYDRRACTRWIHKARRRLEGR